MDIKQTVEAIVAANANREFGKVAELAHSLQDRLNAPQGKLDVGDGYRLLEAISATFRSGGFDGAQDGTDKKVDDLIDALLVATAHDTRSPEAARRAFSELYELLGDTTVPVRFDAKASKISQLVLQLRDTLQFERLARLCDRILTRGDNHALVRIYYAQGLIETERVNAAVAVLRDLLNTPALEPELRAKAHGLLGRAYKQIYVNHARGGNRAVPFSVREALRESIRCYGANLYRKNPTEEENSRWAAVNLAGMLRLAELDRVAPPTGFPDTSKQISDAIIAGFTDDKSIKIWRETASRKPVTGDKSEAWKAATLAEAYLAAGDWDQAAKFFGIFASHSKTSAFQLAGTIRQLEQVWRIRPSDKEAGPILTALRTRLLSLQDGELELSRDDMAATQKLLSSGDPETHARLESVLGGPSPTLPTWWAGGLKWARCVARVKNRDNETMGTGFIVLGTDLDPRLGSELYILTNHHVVCTHKMRHPSLERPALLPEHVRISFDLEEHQGAHPADAPPPFECDSVVWTSPAGELDASLLRLKLNDTFSSRLNALGAVQLAGEPLRLTEVDVGENGQESQQRAAQVFIIGHTGGKDLHISWRHNEVLSMGPKPPTNASFEFLHYRAPTKGGNSGSPVFDEKNWRVVALHHKGELHEALQTPVPLPRQGAYKANEGILITSIRDAIQKADLSTPA